MNRESIFEKVTFCNIATCTAIDGSYLTVRVNACFKCAFTQGKGYHKSARVHLSV